MTKFDAEIVLCGGLRQVNGLYLPATFEDANAFGMAGGEIRVVAAVHHYINSFSRRFMFSTGVSQKERERHGDASPDEARVYGDDFTRRLAQIDPELAHPEVLYEDQSPNTAGNLVRGLRIAQEAGWRTLAILSSDYHMPRVEALYELLTGEGYIPETGIQVQFIGAESSLSDLAPGVYDEVVKAAYATKQAKIRLESERKGLEDIRAGRYTLSEQLRP